MRSLVVFLVDLISYPLGKAIDRSWKNFNFNDKDDQ